MSPNKTRVVVVDDHSIFRSGVIQALHVASDVEVIGEGSSADEALALCETLCPDVALIDLSMPGDGIAATRQLKARCPVTRVVVLTVSEGEDTVFNALEAGAAGYVLKGVSSSELVEIIRMVAGGQTYVPPTLAARLIRSLKPEIDESAVLIEKLSPREKLVLRLMSKGFTNQEIADATGSTVKTIKFHASNIFLKLRLRNRTEVALFASRNYSKIS